MGALPEEIIRTPEGIHVLRDDSHLSRWIENHKRLDIAEPQIAHYAKYIPVGGTVVDAGACLGDQALTYAKLVGPGGTVLAFEPNPLAFKCLALNFERWINVKTFSDALGAKSGNTSFNRDDNAGASYVLGDSGETSVVALDDYCGSLTRLDFIHFDLEGMECHALLGARECLAKFKPAIVLEINHGCLARYGLTEADVLATLAGLGYDWREIEPGHGSHLPQRDILALPRQQNFHEPSTQPDLPQSQPPN